MYYEEKYQNGILYCKCTPQGKWMPVDNQNLSRRVIEAEAKNKLLTEALEKINSLVANSGEKMGNDLLYEIKYTALTTLNQTKNN